MQEEIGKVAGAIWEALNTRKPDCDHAREALLANPTDTRACKGDGRLVG
jgi:hypothetical protein